MSLSSTSNTINALGIFGRHEPELEKYFQNLSEKYSKYPENDDAIGIFNHLSIVIGQNVPVGKLPAYIDLLRELKPFLPLKIAVTGIVVKDGLHIALSFDPKQVKEVCDTASKFLPDVVVKAYYQKVIWFVPVEKQDEVKNILKDVKEMTYDDFILVANKEDDAHTIYSSNRYK